MSFHGKYGLRVERQRHLVPPSITYVLPRTTAIKELSREYAASLGDPGLLRDIERAMAAESDTIEKRRTTTAAKRQVVGA